MPGVAKWQTKIELDIADLKKKLQQAEDSIDEVAKKEYKVDLNIDTKTLESAIQKLDKMLTSLGKGTGDFKEFENLSKELSSIVSEVQSISKSFGALDGKGAKTLLSSIQGIDQSLSSLSQHILDVNNGMNDAGGKAGSIVDQMEDITNAGKKAADSLDGVAKAQEKVNSGNSGKKNRYANRKKISEENFFNYSPNEVNQRLSNSGYTILGGTVNTELVDGLVKVNAKIKDVDGTWKSFSAKVDADGNIFEQRFKTITNGVDKLESTLKNFGRETSPSLTYQKTLNKAKEIKDKLGLSDEYSIKVDSNELVVITKKLNDVDNAGASVTQTFKSADDAINNFCIAASNSAEKTSITLKGVKKASEEVAKAPSPQNDNQEVLKALKDQIAAKKEIEAINLKLAKTSDQSEKDNLTKIQNSYREQYNAAEKILQANSNLYNQESHLAQIEQIRLETAKKIADYQSGQISGSASKLSGYDLKLDGYDDKLSKLANSGWASPSFQTNITAARNAISELRTEIERLQKDPNLIDDKAIQGVKELETNVKKAFTTLSSMSASEKGFTALSGQKEIQKINQILKENTKMSDQAKAAIKAWKKEIESGNPSVSLDVIHAKILEIVNAEEEAGRTGKRMFDVIGEKAWYGVASTISTYFGLNDMIRYGVQAISTVVELDTALIDLKKTTSMNNAELEDFYYTSNDVAKQMGVTTQEIIEQASSWSRLGYNSKEASTEMAQLSSQFASISPGMSTETAQEGLVSIMKAWQVDPEEVKSEIMDPINQLGNMFAESNEDIVNGMERSAAALAAVGTDIDDAFSLFTGIQEVLQNAEVSGRALRSISMRIRGYDETTEELSDDLKNVTGDLVDLTKTAEHSQGVSIFKDGSTTEFKSLVDYFGQIHDIWDEMSQKQQTDFLQKAFGKTQAQAGAALIQNFDAVKDSLEAIDDAAGSSDREMETVRQSLDYKINALKETWVGTAQEIIDRGDLGTIIDGLTAISEGIGGVVGKLGLIKTAALAAAGYLSFKNVGVDKMHSTVLFWYADNIHNFLWIQRFRVCYS